MHTITRLTLTDNKSLMVRHKSKKLALVREKNVSKKYSGHLDVTKGLSKCMPLLFIDDNYDNERQGRNFLCTQ